MIKLKSLLLKESGLLLEMSMPPGFGTNDFESTTDFLRGKEISNKPESNLDFSKIGEAEGQSGEKFMGAPVRDFPDVAGHLQKVAAREKDPKDKYNYPYIHRSNIVDDSGKLLDMEDLKKKFSQRPDTILQRNAKIRKSGKAGGKDYVFYNISLPAFKGLIVDEATNDFKIVDTCPSAGGCRVYCYAKKGGYIQWKSTSLLQTRMLNFLLNDWNGFKTKLIGELKNAINKYKKKGFEIVLRWHDSGDFMSEKYNDINWIEVANNYSGIEIAPCQFNCRRKYFWYYAWDVASGCIWKEDAVKNIKRVKIKV